jgi:alanine dehydrogenase
VVALATNSHEPVLDGSWLVPGQHVGSVQGRELDELTRWRVDLAVVRSRVQPTFHYAEGRRPREAGEPAGSPPGKTVDLAEVVSGRAGRTSPEQLTLFAGGGSGGSSGLGTQFAAVAHCVYVAALEAGIGRELPTDWFTQEEKP